MTFTTLTFFLFLWLVFGLYWAAPSRRWQNVVLLVSSYIFYGWWDYRFTALMLIASIMDFCIALALGRSERESTRKVLLWVGLTGNLTMLGFFKYFNFFSDNVYELLVMMGWNPSPVTLRILLPVGISFYTFQTMSYTIDVYRRKMAPTDRFIDYMAYVAFFPQLVAGPIERATHLLPQFYVSRHFDRAAAADGCRQMLWGMFKKLAIADNVARVVDHYYAQPESSGGVELAFATVCFAFQIYCDFSGYTDIATGSAKLFGFDLMRNFAYPYFSQDVVEFWRRWHISLSTWFRDYVYIPLGGNHVSAPRQAMNILLTFVLSGFWHGASWNFVIWGAINGLAMLPTMFFSKRRPLRATDLPGGAGVLPSPAFIVRGLATFFCICLSWVFFRAADLPTALAILQKMSSELLVTSQWRALLSGMNVLAAVMIVVLLIFEWFQRAHPHPLVFSAAAPRWVRWACYTALLWSTFYLMPPSSNSFIYFQF
jgi:alginate O-acetyltransferase complex protein AlgI